MGSRTEGDIIRRMIIEAQHIDRPSDPIPGVTRTFTDDDDSAGEPWGDEEFEGQWHTPIGATVLEEVLKLASSGLLHVEMRPGLVLDAYRAQGTDRTSTTFATDKVRFVRGANIADELGKTMKGRVWATHGIIKMPDGDYDRAAISGTSDYEQEGYFASAATTSTRLAARPRAACACARRPRSCSGFPTLDPVRGAGARRLDRAIPARARLEREREVWDWRYRYPPHGR